MVEEDTIERAINSVTNIVHVGRVACTRAETKHTRLESDDANNEHNSTTLKRRGRCDFGNNWGIVCCSLCGS